MLLCAQYVLPITAEPIHKGAVLVRDGKIFDIGKTDMLRLRYPDEEVKDFGLAALLPGLIDLHTHLENSVMRGIVHDVPHTTWLMAVAEKSQLLEVSDWYDSAILGGLEALSSGITTIADITSTGAACTATQKLGLRSVIFREVGAMDKRRADFAMRQAESDIAHWQEEVDQDRITIGIAPAALYACHPIVLQKVSEHARKNNLPVALHLAGSLEEFNFIKYGSSALSVHQMDQKRGYVEIPPWLPTGTTPVRYALNWGAFEADNVLAIHCVHVDNGDIAKLKEYNVAIAACPRCNAQLGMGVAPLNEFLRAGLRVGLGTDSPAATDSTDILAEMRIGLLVQRAVNVGQFLDSATMLEMATIGGARALNLDDKIGSLEIGKLADVIAVDLSGSHQMPMTDPVSAVVNTCSGSDVLMSMVAGNTLYEKNRWHVDVEVAKNIARVIEIREKLRK
ncbi:MAG: amidohydrolase family protein [Raoultibacter sp.]|jgi:5-methylthioadenosine/S-adenosylhomocysteine deaminase